MNTECKPSCRLCRNLVISNSVTVVTVNGTDTLVVDLPARFYGDNCKICVIIAQTIPTTATINMPVAFSINGDTTTVFPFVTCKCVQVTACQVRNRTRYSTIVETNSTGGVFKSLGGLSCCPTNNLESLPVVEATATPAVFSRNATGVTMGFSETPVATTTTTKTTKTTKKEVTEDA